MFEDGIDATNIIDTFEANQRVKVKVKYFCEVKTKNMLLFLFRCLSWRLGCPESPRKMGQLKPGKFNQYDHEFVDLFCARLIKSYNKHRPDFIEMYNCDE